MKNGQKSFTFSLFNDVAARSDKVGIFVHCALGDGFTVASGSADRSIKLWNTRTGELGHTLNSHLASVLCLTVLRDGVALASGSADWTVKVWCSATGQLYHTMSGHGGSVFGLQVLRDGVSLASSSDDKTIRIWV